MIRLFWAKTKGHCSNCFRSTRALFIYNRFLAWRRCSRCWTPDEKRFVQLKLNVRVLHSSQRVSMQRRVTTVTRTNYLDGQSTISAPKRGMEVGTRDFYAAGMSVTEP